MVARGTGPNLYLPASVLERLPIRVWVPEGCGLEVVGGRRALKDLAQGLADRGFHSQAFDDVAALDLRNVRPRSCLISVRRGIGRYKRGHAQ
jgi:hypothetical protein